MITRASKIEPSYPLLVDCDHDVIRSKLQLLWKLRLQLRLRRLPQLPLLQAITVLLGGSSVVVFRCSKISDFGE
jgi:hypothetical protein